MPIEFNNVSKSFGGHRVLNRFSHNFPDGRITCILGPSGCGKTTLLNLILGLLTPDEGEIRGMPAGRIPTVFQENRLIEHLSALANVRIVQKSGFPQDEILAALEAVGLKDAAGKPVRELSGGMKRRVALVRALLAEGEPVILDEPFKGLDSETKAMAMKFTLDKLKGRTALIVTHDPEEAQRLNAEILRMPT